MNRETLVLMAGYSAIDADHAYDVLIEEMIWGCNLQRVAESIRDAIESELEDDVE